MIRRCLILNILEFNKVVKKFPGVDAIKEINFSIPENGIHAILGENGAGKSTLMKMVSGNYQIDGGEIIYGGIKRNFTNARDANEAGIFMVYQELSLADELSVAENIFVGREPINHKLFIDWKIMNQKASKLIEMLELDINPETKVKDLLMGEKQLIEVLKAISIDVKLLILDEPTSALSEKEVDKLFYVLRQLKDNGTTILYITHRIDEVFALADDVFVLRNGEYIGSSKIEDINRQELVRMQVGKEIPDFKASSGKVKEKVPVLEVKDYSLPGRFQNLTFNVYKGEILGFYGLLGSGRKELGKALFGTCEHVGGNLLLNGNSLEINSPVEAISASIGYIPEDRRESGLFLELSIAKNIVSANLQEFTHNGLLDYGAISETVEEWIAKFNIKCTSQLQMIKNLSGGNQQKAILAKWFLLQPRLLIVDEPTSGTDVGAKWEVHSLLRDFTASGMSVILISSDIEEIMSVSDRIIVMRRGRIQGELDVTDFTKENILSLASD